MFEVGFSELVVIFVLALIVLGPERLPKVAAQVGQWAGRARRMARMLTTQFQDEMNAVDPRRIMDPPPRATPPAYSRPGVDDLKPGGEAPTATPTEPASGAAPGGNPP
jgi:sec-independent protein translocase protein TatB